MPGYQYAYLNVVATYVNEYRPSNARNPTPTGRKEGATYMVFMPATGDRVVREVSTYLGPLDEYGAEGWVTGGPQMLPNATPPWIVTLAKDHGADSAVLVASYFMRRDLP